MSPQPPAAPGALSPNPGIPQPVPYQVYQQVPVAAVYPPVGGVPQPAGFYPLPPQQAQQPHVVYGTPSAIAIPQAVYVQQQHAAGFHEGVCSCGGDLGPARWTLAAWLMCICCCPFNFSYPYCTPEVRTCQRCAKEYYKPV
ncbi:hypothetical protein VOLCADRAFT_106547 [Volvox carteri f. nagariensis]|uniref:LITAF domain-containing protein n=1 Tax=Volvox carteri f. nagariensis TaxID=3068 RepID=D8U836_VOLCA|nr:uncharacterized protein VOLCADRAFT_106547 [Volvox carteri f. nagariensis]EFJ44075.1 hypothetical protein VOLCADRAFT_106547 [Volvox carteri f. nagariensis]|eukprot:XP_002954876.1 hypothetical protein VOLCADRAFT_106547 [Volvox carteri f. nagariensis]